MATFVHIFPAEKEKSIMSVGIKSYRIHYDDIPKGVFCMPVISDFYATHQWVREIMRRHKNVLAVYFRVPDDLEVYVGKYNNLHDKVSSASAIDVFKKSDDKFGFQVIIPRSISPDEILRIKKIPPLGWRYYPLAKGRTLCLCPACIGGGGYGDKKLLSAKLCKLEKKLNGKLSTAEQINTLSAITELMGDHKLRLKSWESIIEKVDLNDKDVVIALGYFLLQVDNNLALNKVIELMKIAHTDVKVEFVLPILLDKGESGIDILGDMARIPEVKMQIEDFFADIDNNC